LGTSESSKVVTADANGLVTLTKGAVVGANGNFKISSHDNGDNGLYLGTVAVKALASELNYLSGITLGTSESSKVVTADANGEMKLNGFVKLQKKMGFANTALTGSTQEIDPNVAGSTAHYTLDGNDDSVPIKKGAYLGQMIFITNVGTHTASVNIEISGEYLPRITNIAYLSTAIFIYTVGHDDVEAGSSNIADKHMWSRIDAESNIDLNNRRRRLLQMTTNDDDDDNIEKIENIGNNSHHRRHLLSTSTSYLKEKNTKETLLKQINELNDSNTDLNNKLKLMEEASRTMRFNITLGFLFLSLCLIVLNYYNKKRNKELIERMDAAGLLISPPRIDGFKN
jgi:hypothetical protein